MSSQLNEKDLDTTRDRSRAHSSEDELEFLLREITETDEKIVLLILSRTKAARTLRQLRAHNGGPHAVHSDDLDTFRRFGQLGTDGCVIAEALFRLTRD